MPGFGPLLLPRHECPQSKDPTTAPSTPFLGTAPQKGRSGKEPPEVILGLRSSALTLFAHLLLVKNETVPFSCQRLKKIWLKSDFVPLRLDFLSCAGKTMKGEIPVGKDLRNSVGNRYYR